ncbi:hypothetical protein FRC07_007354 [Ceratobasidium sp. 392]|nr:hypothetical protein FRC07_007354 [Ceratobasidium sp. 392]
MINYYVLSQIAEAFSVQEWQQDVADIDIKHGSSTARLLTAQRSRPAISRSRRAPTRTTSTGYHPYPKAPPPGQTKSSSNLHPRVYALAKSGSNRGSPVAGPSSLGSTPESFRSYELLPSAPHSPAVATPPAPTNVTLEPTIVQPSNNEMTPADSVPSQAVDQDLEPEFPTTFTQEQYNRLNNPAKWEEWIFLQVSAATEAIDTSKGPGGNQRAACQYADPLVSAMRCFRKNCFDKDGNLLPRKGFCLKLYGLAEYLRHAIFHRHEERITRKLPANDLKATRFYEAALDYQEALDRSNGITYHWSR